MTPEIYYEYLSIPLTWIQGQTAIIALLALMVLDSVELTCIVSDPVTPSYIWAVTRKNGTLAFV